MASSMPPLTTMPAGWIVALGIYATVAMVVPEGIVMAAAAGHAMAFIVPQISRFPPVEASKMPQAMAAVHALAPLFAANVTFAPVVFEADAALGKLVALFVTAARAYPGSVVPSNSVPPPASVGATA